MMYSIKETCKITGLTPRALRYYDHVGLLKPAYRQDNKYRFYSDENIMTLRIIHELRSVEFSLEEIKHILTSDINTAYELFSHHKKNLLHQASRAISMAEKTEHMFELMLSYDAQKSFLSDYAILFMNLQNEFFTGKFSNPDVSKILPQLQNLYQLAHKLHIPVIYVRAGEADGVGSINTFGSQIIKDMEVRQEDFQLVKQYYDAFIGTNLDDTLKQLNCKNLVISGVYTDLAIYHTSLSAWYKGYQLYFFENCTVGKTAEKKKFALESLSESCSAIIKDSYQTVFENI